jgi:hypothetical protein
MVIVIVACAEEPELLKAYNVTTFVPTAVGVPEIKPLAEVSDRPFGKPEAVKDVGLLSAEMV